MSTGKNKELMKFFSKLGKKSSPQLLKGVEVFITHEECHKLTEAPFTPRLIFGTARIKQAPVPILSVLGLPIYTVQVRIKLVRVPVLCVPCQKLSVV